MKLLSFFVLTLWSIASSCEASDRPNPPPDSNPTPDRGLQRIQVPPEGTYYHGVYPGGVSGEEDDITPADVAAYETAVGRKVAWVYFSHNWYRGRQFPIDKAHWIRDMGAVPFIRLMLRSDSELEHADPMYSLTAIIAGSFDDDLRAWGRAAREYGWPIIAEWGTEVNGRWFPWNGVWNGGAGEGPWRFRQAFRRVVDTIRGEGAANVTWVFHVNDEDDPEEDWNRLEHYYPGDDVVDWVAFSSYGAQSPLDEEWPAFTRKVDALMPRLVRMAPGKPVVVAEFGATAGNPLGNPSNWADDALAALLAGRWPSIRGFAWWNETFANDANPAHDTEMRVQVVPELASVFRMHLTKDNVVEHPIISK
jgi:hypothetical protein